jgi:predicted Zn-dependent peptidase
MEAQFYTLKNGLQVIFIDTKAFPTLTTLLLIGAGSRFENEKNNGIAHFFEHMAFKGSKKYPNTFIISSTIEGLGGIFNAFTTKDHTGYWIKSTTEHFETVIDVIADMVQNPLLIDEEIQREKGVIVEEINMYEDMPQRKVGDLFENLLYQGSPLGYDISGKKDGVQSFNRLTFTGYIKNLYHPKNAVLVVAGGFSSLSHPERSEGSPTNVGFLNKVRDPSTRSLRSLAQDDMLEIIERKFSDWQNGVKGEFEKVREKQTKPQILLKHKKTEQTHFCLGFRAFSFFDQRKYALSLLATILGGGMSSRLFIEVRERLGLCYYISTGRELYHDVGNMVTQAGVANNLDKIKKAIEAILKEHKKIIKDEVKKEELKKAKELVKGRLLLSLEDSFDVAYFFGTKKILEDKSETPQELIEKLEKIAKDDIVNIACDIFKPENLNLAMIGPFERRKELEKVLHI